MGGRVRVGKEAVTQMDKDLLPPMGASGRSGKPTHSHTHTHTHTLHPCLWKRPVKVCLILAAGRGISRSYHIWSLGCALHKVLWSRESVRLKCSQDPPVGRTEHLLSILSKVPRGPVAVWTIAVNCRRSTGPRARRLGAKFSR